MVGFRIPPWLYRLVCYTLFLTLLVLPVRAQETPQVVRVGIYENEPKIFIDEDGNPAGFFVDLLFHLSHRLNFEIQYVEVTWDEGMSLLKKGRIDLMPDVTVTPERLEKYVFNEVAILENWASLYIHADAEPSYYTLQDIHHKSIAVMEGDGNLLDLKQELGKDTSLVNFIELSNYQKTFAAVEDEKADMALVSYYFGIYRRADFDVQPLQLVINPNTVHFAGSPGPIRSLIGKIDQELVIMKRDEDSAYYRLLDKWLTRDNYFRFPRWLSWLLAGMVTSLLILLIAILALQVRLRRRKGELSRINKKLTQNIRVKTRIEESLRNRNQELAKTNEAMDQLIYQVSHNLRSPIASVLGLINILRLELPNEAITGQPISKMESSMQRLDTIISDILDYYRNSRMDIALNEVDLKEMASDIFESMAHVHAAGRVKTEISISQTIPLYTDKRRIKSILHNLISNALKYADQARDNPYVKVIAEITPTYADIRVEDNGLGIAPDQQDKIFSMFYRATTQGHGAGLGLYIIKETIEKLEGRITVDSVPGRGTTFTFRIPNLHQTQEVPEDISL
ncbi:ATP-binding protein [Roseivirga sp. BDSF3-8]|uniref:ATP-binding protein n=1 Tax=Roseivirga sp. BDSF3-8 TaxID=3241598 RepID=UPI00353256A6